MKLEKDVPPFNLFLFAILEERMVLLMAVKGGGKGGHFMGGCKKAEWKWKEEEG
jgi:hypothetical protein